MTKLLYYPGCTLKTMAKGFDKSSIEVFKELGIELKEMERWNCCGTVYSLTSDDLIHHLAPIRNFIRVKEENSNELVTFCSMCYNTLKQSNIRVRNNPEDLEKINNLMDEEIIKYDGSVEVLHGIEVLRDRIGIENIKKRVKKKLKLKVAPYYGCLLLRPDEVKIDDPECPTILDEIISSVGCEPIDFPYKNECCGAYQTVNRPDIVAERVYAILSSAKSFGAEIVITSCPLCQFNLDRRQKLVKEKYSSFNEIPVIYFTQLISVAFDLPFYHSELNYVKPPF